MLRHAPHSFTDLLSRGDLIIISVVLAAGSIGEMLARKTTSGFSTPELVILGFGMLLLLCGTGLYAIVSTASPGDDANLGVVFSFGTFAGTLAIGGSSIWVGSS